MTHAVSAPEWWVEPVWEDGIRWDGDVPLAPSHYELGLAVDRSVVPAGAVFLDHEFATAQEAEEFLQTVVRVAS